MLSCTLRCQDGTTKSVCLIVRNSQQPTTTPCASDLSCTSGWQSTGSSIPAVFTQACALTGIKADRVSVVTDDIIDKISGLRNTDGEAHDFMHCLDRWMSWQVSQHAA